VVDGAALLADPGDVVAIRVQLVRLLEDDVWRVQAMARGMGRAGEMTWERCIRRTLDVYRAVV